MFKALKYDLNPTWCLLAGQSDISNSVKYHNIIQSNLYKGCRQQEITKVNNKTK